SLPQPANSPTSRPTPVSAVSVISRRSLVRSLASCSTKRCDGGSSVAVPVRPVALSEALMTRIVIRNRSDYNFSDIKLQHTESLESRCNLASMLTRAGQDLSPVDETERRALGVGVGGRRRPFVVELLIFTIALLGYLLLLPSIVWYPAYLALGDSHWWMFVVNSVAPYLFLPVPIIMVLALLARRWGLVVTALVPTVVFVLL